jgi:hypothetical protein
MERRKVVTMKASAADLIEGGRAIQFISFQAEVMLTRR